MKTIELTQGMVVMVDDSDYDFLMQWKWFVNKLGGTYYAVRSTYDTETKKHGTVLMHRVIMGLADREMFVDHKDHNGLNNQRSNLRLATKKNNAQNKRSHTGSTSKYLGVYSKNRTYFRKKTGEVSHYQKWVARIRVDDKNILLGHFDIEEDAARAYDKAALETRGEFANLNFK